jgi:hypothetical protein
MFPKLKRYTHTLGSTKENLQKIVTSMCKWHQRSWKLYHLKTTIYKSQSQ